MSGWMARVAVSGLLLCACSAEPPDSAPADERPATAAAGRSAADETSGVAPAGRSAADETSGAAPASATGRDAAASARPEIPGRWRALRPERLAPELSDEQRDLIARLEAIGYASGSTDASGESGVVRFDPERAQPGLNFYTSGHGPEAILMDMEGRVLHRWRREFLDVWPDYPRRWLHDGMGFWRRAHLGRNGSVIAVFEGAGIVKVDRDSRVVWSNPVRAHHDLEVMPDGTIYVLTRKARVVPHLHPERPVLEDFVTVLDEDGVEQRHVSLLRALERSPFAGSHPVDVEATHGDVFHTNTLEVLDGSLADRHPAFAKGNVLVSLLKLHLIGVVDLDARAFVWVQEGPFRFQHDPKVLESGRLLLFDNRGAGRRSRVLEFAPGAERPDWVYEGTPEAPFFSYTCGAAERLANGNTLITESDGGRAFEVTPGREIVWEFVNPERAGEDGELIATLFEMLRLPPEFPVGWAEGDGEPAAR